MGGIPRIENIPRTEPLRAPRFSPSASPAAFGGALAEQASDLGRVVARAGEVTSDIGDRLLRDEEEAKVLAGIAEYRGEVRDVLYGNNGITKRQGRNADGATLEARERLEKLREQRGKEFVTQRSLEAWNRLSAGELDSATEVAARHQSIEMRRFQTESLQAHAESSILKAVDERDNPATRQKARREVARDIARLYDGWGEDAIALKQREAFYSIDARIIDAYRAESRDADALEYLQEHQKEIDPAYMARIKPALEAKVRRDKILAHTHEIANLPPEEQLEIIKKKYTNADDYDEARARVERNIRTKAALDRNAQAAIDGQAMEAAIQLADQGVFDFDAPPEVSTDRKIRIAKYLQQREALALKGQKAVADDDETRQWLFREAGRNPAQFAAIDLYELEADMKLSTATRKTLQSMQNDILSGRGVSARQWDSEIAQMEEDILSSVGYGKEHLDGTTDTKKKAKIKAARDRMHRLIQGFEKEGLKVGERGPVQEFLKEAAEEILLKDRTWPAPNEYGPRFMHETYAPQSLEAYRRESSPSRAALAPAAKGTTVAEPKRPKNAPPEWPWDAEVRGFVKRVNGKTVMWIDEWGFVHGVKY